MILVARFLLRLREVGTGGGDPGLQLSSVGIKPSRSGLVESLGQSLVCSNEYAAD